MPEQMLRRIEDLVQRLDHLGDVVERLRAERDQFRDSALMYAARVAELNAEIEQLRAERNKAIRERDSLARRLGVRWGELEETRAALRQMTDERDHVHGEALMDDLYRDWPGEPGELSGDAVRWASDAARREETR